jgi:hypothetical protein
MPKTKKKKNTTASQEAAHQETETKKIQLEFYGSEVLKKNAPQAFELAEAVAEEWMNDGDFQKLPLNHPFAQLVAAVSLKSAKKIEKKLEERGVFMMAKVGLDYAKKKWPLKENKSV